MHKILTIGSMVVAIVMFLIFGLNRPDVFPFGDLALKKAVGKQYGITGIPKDKQLGTIADNWKPYRTIAAWYLWASIDGVPFDDSEMK